MKRVKSFDEFVNEYIGAALGSPIKFIKIKKAAKRYQQAKLKQALNDVDYEKKNTGDFSKRTFIRDLPLWAQYMEFLSGGKHSFNLFII